MRILKVVFLTFGSFALIYILTVKLLKSPIKAESKRNEKAISPVSTPVNFELVKEHDPIRSELQRFFDELKKRFGFNGNVLISQGSQVLYEASFGKSGLSNQENLDSNSVFQIASLSKQFTAIAVLQLVEQGKVALHQSFQHYFPKFPYPEVTIDMLLTHRSGLANYMYFCDAVCDRSKPICNNEVLRLMCERKPSPYLPANKKFDYSNTGYALLACLVEEVAGMSFMEYAEKHLFTPLGMNSTYVYDKCKPARVERSTLGYDPNGRPAEDTYLDGVTGDKGIHTTARDLLRWSIGLDQAAILSRELLRDAWTSHSPELKAEENYGYGFRIRNFSDGKKVVYHAGWWHGYHALFMKLLHNNVSIILLTNRVNWSIKNMDQLQHILNQYYPGSV